MKWTKLSCTLPYPRSLTCCQSCGETEKTKPNLLLSKWVECAEDDRPTTTVVVLCESCSKKIIEPHPRLYARAGGLDPIPGTMLLCADCKWREAINCKSPKLLENGGPGLKITFPQPITGFVDGRRGGKRFGHRYVQYTGPATACEGKECQGP